MSLIISLTSTSSRLPILKYTLLSLLDQKRIPDRIILCISKEPYLVDEGISQLPVWLKSMVDQNKIEIMWVTNIGPYRKLMPVYQTASTQDWVVTCDDDVIYGPDWLGCLVSSACKHPNAIVCGRARRPTKNFWGRTQSYLNWPVATLACQSKNLVPIGLAGVLYRKSLLDHRIMSSNDFIKLAPKQDDLWFNLARQMADTNVAICPDAGRHVHPVKASNALSTENASSKVSGWDKLLSAIFDRLILRIKAYLGQAACDNDLVIRHLDQYKCCIKRTDQSNSDSK